MVLKFRSAWLSVLLAKCIGCSRPWLWKTYETGENNDEDKDEESGEETEDETIDENENSTDDIFFFVNFYLNVN